jgi:hypothetical protein
VLGRGSENKAFSVGKGARVGNIGVGGHIAGRDVVVSTTAAGAASTQDMAQVLEVPKQVEQQIANLTEAPSGLRDDAQDEVRKAPKAGAQGDTSGWLRSWAPRRPTWNASVRPFRLLLGLPGPWRLWSCALVARAESTA